MTWHQSSTRLLTLLIDGEPSGWTIQKFGLQPPYRYELWRSSQYHGAFDSAADAQQHQQRIADENH